MSFQHVILATHNSPGLISILLSQTNVLDSQSVGLMQDYFFPFFCIRDFRSRKLLFACYATRTNLLHGRVQGEF